VVQPAPAPAPAPKEGGAVVTNNNNPPPAPVPPAASPMIPAVTPTVVAALPPSAPVGVRQEDMDLLQKELAQLNDQLTASSQTHRMLQTVIGSTFTVAATVYAGYVVWILRSSSLLAGALAGLPVWRFLDPLPVLDRWRKRRPSKPEDQDVDDNTRKLDAMFK